MLGACLWLIYLHVDVLYIDQIRDERQLVVLGRQNVPIYTLIQSMKTESVIECVLWLHDTVTFLLKQHIFPYLPAEVAYDNDLHVMPDSMSCNPFASRQDVPKDMLFKL